MPRVNTWCICAAGAGRCCDPRRSGDVSLGGSVTATVAVREVQTEGARLVDGVARERLRLQVDLRLRIEQKDLVEHVGHEGRGAPVIAAQPIAQVEELVGGQVD